MGFGKRAVPMQAFHFLGYTYAQLVAPASCVPTALLLNLPKLMMSPVLKLPILMMSSALLQLVTMGMQLVAAQIKG